jgi:glycosyltransferase involved in cell wall biosynthesis
MDRTCGGPADIFHATDFLLPSLRKMPSVFTLHDVSFLEYPETHLASNRWFLRLMVPIFVRQASAVIAVSKHTASDIVRRYAVPESKMYTIPLGVDPRFHPIDDAASLATTQQKYNLPSRFILSVGTIEPRKNHLALLHAYEKLRATTGEEIGLVIVGRRGWKAQGFLSALARSPVRDSVILAGQVADEDLPAIYNLAECFAYPSWYEGFGLPPLEAMACGVPVICANNSSLPEVVGDAGLLVDSSDDEGLARAMLQVTSQEDLRSTMAAQGKARAKSFSWQTTAERTHEVYQEVYRRHLTASKRNG